MGAVSGSRHRQRHGMCTSKPRGDDMRGLSLRAQTEAVIAIAAAVLCTLTIVWPDWIEGLTGFDPDHHSGWLEWLIVVVLVVLSLACGLRTRRALRATPALDRQH
jgi:hypothetical protein